MLDLVKPSKVTVVGAGSVGSSVAYATAIRGVAHTVALYDINTEKVDAEVLDLAHGSQFMGSSIVGGSDIEYVADSDVVVITAGARQKPGQSRLDLAGDNVKILSSLLPQLLEQAPDAIYILVTNPCDVLTKAALEISGLPTSRVFSSGTVLDTSRLRWLISRRLGVSPGSVHALMMGEHGDTEFALWSSATIGQTPLREWTDPEGNRVFNPEVLSDLETDVTEAAYRVIQGKGATNYAIGVAGARILEAIFKDQHAILPVSTMLENYRGVSGVALSVPSIVSAAGVERTLEMPMDGAELRSLHRSAEALAHVQKELGL